MMNDIKLKLSVEKRVTYPIIYAYSCVLCAIGLATSKGMANHIVKYGLKIKVIKP